MSKTVLSPCAISLCEGGFREGTQIFPNCDHLVFSDFQKCVVIMLTRGDVELPPKVWAMLGSICGEVAVG